MRTKKTIGVVVAVTFMLISSVQVYAYTALDSNITELIRSGIDEIKSFYVTESDVEATNLEGQYTDEVNKHIKDKSNEFMEELDNHKNNEINRANEELDSYVEEAKSEITNQVNKSIDKSKSNLKLKTKIKSSINKLPFRR